MSTERSPLADSILRTLEYFDVQDKPLTLLELHKYLLADSPLKLADGALGKITALLETELADRVGSRDGFWFLRGRGALVARRLRGNYWSVPRLKRARRLLPLARFLPFVRGASVGGSEALSNSKRDSDIDVLLFTAPRRIWTARIAATALFQILGVRRHGDITANRFCLNHYVAGAKRLPEDHNAYTAIEYAAQIPAFNGHLLHAFLRANREWIASFLPNAPEYFIDYPQLPIPAARRAAEWLLSGWFGNLVETAARRMQLRRIIAQNYIVTAEDELSFHPGSKGQQVLAKYREKAQSA